MLLYFFVNHIITSMTIKQSVERSVCKINTKIIIENNKIWKSSWGIMECEIRYIEKNNNVAANTGRWGLTVQLWSTELRSFYLRDARRKRVESMRTSVPGLTCRARLWPLHASCALKLTVFAAPLVNSCICHISLRRYTDCTVL